MVQDILSESRRQRDEATKNILRANDRLPERMRDEGFEIEYDSELDYLRLTIGEPRESLAISLKDGVFQSLLLYDPATYFVLGFEVPFFKEKLQRDPPKGDFLWSLAELLEKSGDGTRIRIPSGKESARIERAFRDLVRAF